jgi:hypothetical protein
MSKNLKHYTDHLNVGIIVSNSLPIVFQRVSGSVRENWADSLIRPSPPQPFPDFRF